MPSMEDMEIRMMALDFEYPTKFIHPDKYKDFDLSEEFFIQIPAVVTSDIMESMGMEIPIDPQMPLVFLRQHRLSEFVVAWFMENLPKSVRSRVAKSTLFFRALHAIERYRAYLYTDPEEVDSDPILAAGGALASQLLPPEEEEAKGTKPQDPQHQDPQPQDPQRQDPQPQDPQRQDPQPQDPASQPQGAHPPGLPRWRGIQDEDSNEGGEAVAQPGDDGAQPDPLNDAFVDESQKED